MYEFDVENDQIYSAELEGLGDIDDDVDFENAIEIDEDGELDGLGAWRIRRTGRKLRSRKGYTPRIRTRRGRTIGGRRYTPRAVRVVGNGNKVPSTLYDHSIAMADASEFYFFPSNSNRSRSNYGSNPLTSDFDIDAISIAPNLNVATPADVKILRLAKVEFKIENNTVFEAPLSDIMEIMPKDAVQNADGSTITNLVFSTRAKRLARTIPLKAKQKFELNLKFPAAIGATLGAGGNYWEAKLYGQKAVS